MSRRQPQAGWLTMFELLAGPLAVSLLDIETDIDTVIAGQGIGEALPVATSETATAFTMPADLPQPDTPARPAVTEAVVNGEMLNPPIDPQFWLAAAMEQLQLKVGTAQRPQALRASENMALPAMAMPFARAKPAVPPGAVAGLPLLIDLPAPALQPSSFAATLASAAPVEFSAPPLAAPERHLSLVAPQARWGEQMLQVLRETVEMQVRQGFQQAVIRLDPVELGSLEIRVSHEAGRVSVQLFAAQQDVSRMLQAGSERLRLELAEQHFTEVHVQVSQEQHEGQRGRRSHAPDEPDEAVADNPRHADGVGVWPDAHRERAGHRGLLVTV